VTTTTAGLMPCSGEHYQHKEVCTRRESCVRYRGVVDPKKANLIVGINIKNVDECIFFVEVV
jgi:hypothetical protein